MDEKKIQAFLTVVKLGSINKAAERLDYTQEGLELCGLGSVQADESESS